MSKDHFILGDTREDKRIIDAIEHEGVPIEIQQLGIGDFVISDRIVIERKRSDKTYDPINRKYHNDLRDSLFDGRLYTELHNQKEQFEISILIVECADKRTFYNELFTKEKWEKAQLTITLKMDTHIFYTNSYAETAKLIMSFWERAIRESHGVPINRDPRPKTLRDKQRYLLAGLEGCGPKKVDLLLDEFRSPDVVFNWIKYPHKSIKGFGKKFFESNRALLLERDAE